MRPILLCLLMLAAPVFAGEDLTPVDIAAGSTLEIVGPGSIAMNEDAFFKIQGLSLDEIKQAKKDGLFDLTVFPLNGIRVHATYDWLGDSLELMVRGSAAGQYLLKLHLARSGKLEIAVVVVVVEGDPAPFPPGPDPPTPPVPPDPGPRPLPAGDRLVLILSESANRTPAEAETLTLLRRHLQSKTPAPLYQLLDPDTPTVGNWADPIKAEVARRRVALPALVVCVLPTDTRPEHIFAVVETLPGRGQEAIAQVDEVLK